MPPLPPLPPPDREPSSAMGDLLLGGWTMLADTCGGCGRMPLMRDKRGGRGDYCCECRAFVQPAAADQPAGQQQEKEEDAAPAPASPVPAAPRVVVAAVERVAAAAPAPRPYAPMPPSTDAATILTDARAALLTRLTLATAGVARPGACAADAAAHAACVAECARALAAVDAALK